MIEGAFALAFTAGLVSTLNPCGFAMLPAYMSYFMGLGAEGSADRTAAVRQGRAWWSAAIAIGRSPLWACGCCSGTSPRPTAGTGPSG